MVSLGNLGFEEQVELNKDFVNQYCKQENVDLNRVEKTWESGFLEPMYFFDNGLGGYTINGIVWSLRE